MKQQWCRVAGADHELIAWQAQCDKLDPAMLAVPAAAQWSAPSADLIIVRGGWLFDGVTNTRRRNTGLVIRDDRFFKVDAGAPETVGRVAGTYAIARHDVWGVAGGSVTIGGVGQSARNDILQQKIFEPETTPALVRARRHKPIPL